MKNICYPQVTQTPLLTLLLRKPSFGFVRPNSATCILANKDGLFVSFCELARNGNPGALVFTTTTTRAADPLPSWNEGKAKKSVTAFVEKVTKQGSFRLLSALQPHHVE
jgi:hypothetical protein